ncbi:MAG TPA: methyltransferase domain-containing protein [Longimicrobiales bacterium]|nr:methyltransferase domain-containing protein [Longimicrobiales bacterium]
MPDADFEALLDRHAPLAPAPLCPEIQVFQAHSLTDVWEAVDRLAGEPTDSPFWAYAWPAGAALARVVLDRPALVRGLNVLDIGAGGGVAALAAAKVGAARVVANDEDPRALDVVALAAARQDLPVKPAPGDVLECPHLLAEHDVVLCADLGYERDRAPRLHALLRDAHAAGATVLVADAGRKYFEPAGMAPLARFEIAVPEDLEGVPVRTAVVYRLA